MSLNFAAKEAKALFAHTGNMCAFHNWGRCLIEPVTGDDEPAVLA